jgi:hypothetical protein
MRSLVVVVCAIAALVAMWVNRRDARCLSDQAQSRLPSISPTDSVGLDLEKSLALYAQASEFLRYEGNLVWSRFSGMVVVHSIVIGFLALASTADRELPEWGGAAIALAGLVLTYFWRRLLNIGVSHHETWKEVLRVVEDQVFVGHPAHSIVCLFRGRFAKTSHQFGKAHKTQEYVILTFIVAYTLILIAYGIQFRGPAAECLEWLM